VTRLLAVAQFSMAQAAPEVANAITVLKKIVSDIEVGKSRAGSKGVLVDTNEARLIATLAAQICTSAATRPNRDSVPNIDTIGPPADSNMQGRLVLPDLSIANMTEHQRIELKRAETQKEVQQFLATVEVRIESMEKQQKGMIMPASRVANSWDVMVLFALIYTAFVTPLEVSMLNISVNGLYWANRCVDLIFATDMYLHLSRMMYFNNNGTLVNNRAQIRTKYLRGWFWFDFVTLIPYDLISHLVEPNRNFVSLRMIRLFRLVKLGRVGKSSSVFVQKFEFQRGIVHTTLMGYQVGMQLMVMIHWLACFWAMLPTLEPADSYTWLSAWMDADERTVPPECTTALSPYRNGGHREGCVSTSQIYAAALHWAVMTITSIGYGMCTHSMLFVSIFHTLSQVTSCQRMRRSISSVSYAC
jgi:hypothetical protein